MESDQQKGKAGRRAKDASASQPEEEKRAPEETVKKSRAGKRFEIDIFRDWCKSCGICAEFCPRGCIGLDDEGAPTRIDSDRCTGCGWCELHCPDFAISVHRKSDKKGAKEGAEEA